MVTKLEIESRQPLPSKIDEINLFLKNPPGLTLDKKRKTSFIVN
jgi:hypothetical protein